jgi:hypothetical protein
MFALYIPGRHRNDNAILHEVGAGWALDPSVTAMFVDVENGPDAGMGKLVYFDSRRRMSPYQIVSLNADAQEWLPAAKDGEQAEGRYWLGVPKAHNPTPDDLQRETVIDGLPVTLCDKQQWVIPIADYFPRRLTLNRSTGMQEDRPFAAHLPFINRTNEMFRLLIGDEFQGRIAEELRVQIPDGLIYAAEALEMNYRVNRDMVDMLGLIGEFEAVKIAGVATGLELLETIETQKKTRLLAMPSCDS